MEPLEFISPNVSPSRLMDVPQEQKSYSEVGKISLEKKRLSEDNDGTNHPPVTPCHELRTHAAVFKS